MSHWLNPKTILEKSDERGHEVTVMDQGKHSTVHFETITVSFGNKTAVNFQNYTVYIVVNVISTMSCW